MITEDQDKTRKVARSVLRDILNGTYARGKRVPTEREMARLTGASRITVRRAFARLQAAGIPTLHPWFSFRARCGMKVSIGLAKLSILRTDASVHI